MNKSCAIVRPHTRIVVCSRWSAVNVRGTSSNHCLAFSTGRPRRLRSSRSNSASCASIASSDIGSVFFGSFVVLMSVLFLGSRANDVERRGALDLGSVGLDKRLEVLDL